MLWKMLFSQWMAAIFLVPLTVADLDGVYVRVHEGLLRGKKMISKNGRSFLGFLKIPYAMPPVGKLRFELPQKPAVWKNVRDATESGSICLQRNVYVKNKFFVAGDEDCLYLCVYTPRVNATQEKDLLPVMVFLHGGGWVSGSGNYYPPEFLLDRDIVYISINYRLGPLGFLSMEDEVLPGNLGLKDQNEALRWVQRNIKFFGGNPKLVTLFGESAGGSSVHFHMISPMSRDLFHRGISQSGTAMCSWSLGQPGITRKNTIRLAKVLGCPVSPTENMVKCLKKKPAAAIIETDVEFMVWNKEPMIPFKPVIEKLGDLETAFLPEHPVDIIRSGRAAHLPWMTGLNSEDGAMGVASFYEDSKLTEELNKNFNLYVPIIFFLHSESGINTEEAARQIKRFYFGGKPIDNSTISNVVNLYTDGWFLAGIDEAVRLMYKYSKSPIYYYYFSYRGSASFSSIFGNTTRDFGVCHADELMYLFPMERLFPHNKFTEKDEQYMRIFLNLWTNFATYGDPTPTENELITEKWKPISSENFEYYHLSQEGATMKENLLPERTTFWSILKRSRKLTLHDEL